MATMTDAKTRKSILMVYLYVVSSAGLFIYHIHVCERCAHIYSDDDSKNLHNSLTSILEHYFLKEQKINENNSQR